MDFDTRGRKLRTLIREFNTGAIQLPQFQRDFLWKPRQVRNLLDSLHRGFPIGGVYLWEPTPGTDIDAKRKAFSEPRFSGEAYSYLIDGQQRLTGLEAAFSLYSEEEKPRGEEFRCYLDLEAIDLERVRDTRLFVSYGGNQKIAARADAADSTLIPLSRLFDVEDAETRSDLRNEIEHILESLGWNSTRTKEALNRLDRACVMLDQLVPCTVVTGADDPVAIEIFNRLNSGGKRLSQGDVKAAELARSHAVPVLKRMRQFVSSERSRRLGFGFSFAFWKRHVYFEPCGTIKMTPPAV